MSTLLEEPRLLAQSQERASLPIETKVCGGCGYELSVGMFRPKKRIGGIVAGRHSDCAACHRKAMRQLRAKKKTKEIRSFVSFASREESYERMLALINATSAMCGGVIGLAKAFVEEIERARQHPESPVRARCLLAYFNILIMVEQNKPPEPSLGQMSDEELAVQMVASMMRENPEAVVMIGETLGWTLSPPAPEPESQDSTDVGAKIAHA